jgi:lipopolysaccharide transport protein LptA
MPLDQLYRRSRCHPIVGSLLAALGLLTGGTANADQQQLSDQDTIVVHADEAWQGDDAQVLHLRGRLKLHAPNWSIEADRARLFGPLEDPDSIFVDGAPATIKVRQPNRDGYLTAEGAQIQYQPQSNILYLTGDAIVDTGDTAIASETIEYRVRDETFTAGKSGRVHVIANPD